MGFVNARDLTTSLKDTREKLVREGELTVLLNGKPIAIMLDVQNDDYETVLREVRQAKALRTLRSLRTQGQERGFLSDAEINAEIAAARKDRKQGRSKTQATPTNNKSASPSNPSQQ